MCVQFDKSGKLFSSLETYHCEISNPMTGWETDVSYSLMLFGMVLLERQPKDQTRRKQRWRSLPSVLVLSGECIVARRWDIRSNGKARLYWGTGVISKDFNVLSVVSLVDVIRLQRENEANSYSRKELFETIRTRSFHSTGLWWPIDDSPVSVSV